MARLSANGVEVVRFVRHREDDEAVNLDHLSFRSNGWVLQKVNVVWKDNYHKSPGRWRRHRRWKRKLSIAQLIDILQPKGYEVIS